MSNANETMITYTKLRNGSWGLRGPASALRAGAQVTVTKRSGESKTVRVGRVLWSNDTTAIATVQRGSSRNGGSSYRRRGGSGWQDSCGYPCPVDGHRCTPANPCHDCQ